MITFKYNNKQYTTNNLENKLNKLGITKEDIEILGNRDLGEIDTSIKKYYFKNIKTGEIIVSVFDGCFTSSLVYTLKSIILL